MTCSTAIALRNQAHNFLRLALDSDDRSVREKYLNAAREALAERELAIERSRLDNFEDIHINFPEAGLMSENASQISIEDDEVEGEESDENEESDSAEEQGDGESEEDQEWGENDDEESEEEEWDVNNGKNSSKCPSPSTHYFANGPGKNEPDLITPGTRIGLPAQETIQVSNLEVRVYARMMELFEIESRHRLNICNSEYALQQARYDFAQLNMSKQVSGSTQISA
ncbi:hypothetical protein EG328_010211 [Venturia inaequalis]|uniref:Uncharacterized protein n=1 Tax=Venturia inaequalis TaxID=5025 RepID=A0A8H3U835_VENIN|nr:hypothetical protein EG328_010211 [Venturia inaequalis]